MNKEVEDMSEMGVIEPSYREWHSLILLGPKPDCNLQHTLNSEDGCAIRSVRGHSIHEHCQPQQKLLGAAIAYTAPKEYSIHNPLGTIPIYTDALWGLPLLSNAWLTQS